MNFRVRPTPSALEDALTIGRWIAAEGSPLTAERWVVRLREDLTSLSTFPDRHPFAPESSDFQDLVLRQRLFGDYRVLFTVVEADVVVLHIRHGSRKPADRDEMLGRLAEAPTE